MFNASQLFGYYVFTKEGFKNFLDSHAKAVPGNKDYWYLQDKNSFTDDEQVGFQTVKITDDQYLFHCGSYKAGVDYKFGHELLKHQVSYQEAFEFVWNNSSFSKDSFKPLSGRKEYLELNYDEFFRDEDRENKDEFQLYEDGEFQLFKDLGLPTLNGSDTFSISDVAYGLVIYDSHYEEVPGGFKVDIKTTDQIDTPYFYIERSYFLEKIHVGCYGDILCKVHRLK